MIYKENWEMEWMDHFADDQTIYIVTINQRIASRALQGVINKLDAWATERDQPFPLNNSKHDI